MYDNAQSSTIQKGLREPTSSRMDKHIRVHAHNDSKENEPSAAICTAQMNLSSIVLNRSQTRERIYLVTHSDGAQRQASEVCRGRRQERHYPWVKSKQQQEEGTGQLWRCRNVVLHLVLVSDITLRTPSSYTLLMSVWVHISIERKTFADQHFHILLCGCSYAMGVEYLVQILSTVDLCM